jgi:hypothetical protein
MLPSHPKPEHHQPGSFRLLLKRTQAPESRATSPAPAVAITGEPAATTGMCWQACTAHWLAHPRAVTSHVLRGFKSCLTTL